MPITPEQRESKRRAQAKWREANRDRLAQYDAAYYQTHRDDIKAKKSLRSEETQEARDRHAKLHPQANQGYQRKYRQSYADQRANANAARRALLRQVEINDFTDQDWQDLLIEHDHSCFYCHTTEQSLQREHKTPLIRGGWHTKSNIVPACGPCNYRKGRMTDEEFLACRSREK